MREEAEVRERLVGRSVQLPPGQWRWLDQRAQRTHSRSASHEIRRLIAQSMEAEQKEAMPA